MTELEDFFLISSWDGVCADASKERATVIASVPAQKAAAQGLQWLLQQGHSLWGPLNESSQQTSAE